MVGVELGTHGMVVGAQQVLGRAGDDQPPQLINYGGDLRSFGGSVTSAVTGDLRSYGAPERSCCELAVAAAPLATSEPRVFVHYFLLSS